MKIAILGAGKQATGALEYLSRFPKWGSPPNGPHHIVLADNNKEAAENLAKKFAWATWYENERLSQIDIKTVDASKQDDITSLLMDCDVAFNALPFSFALNATRAAIESKTHMVDLGGNSEIVNIQLSLTEEAAKAGITIIPDCGLAPGFVGIIVADAVENSHIKEMDSIKIRVGGLPAYKKEGGPLEYGDFFSLKGLLNEYQEPVVVLRKGKIEIIEPLTEHEILYGNYGELEAFTTSGGSSTLPYSFQDEVKNLDYKTIRYPGHLNALRLLKAVDCFNTETFKKLCKPDLRDDVVVKVEAKGRITSPRPATITRSYSLDGRYYFSDDGSRCDTCQYCYDDDGNRNCDHDISRYPLITAMMQCTAWPATIIMLMLPDVAKNFPGVQRQEQVINPILFFEELSKTDLDLKVSEKVEYH
jgi:lysine 6-dehydrogenase